MKSDAERGPFGAWLVKQRKARPGAGRDGSMTADEVRRAVQLAAGLGISPSVYAELESGTRYPSGDQRQALEAWAGEGSPRRQEADLSGIVGALEGIVDVLRDGFRLRDEVIGLRVEVASLAAEVEGLRLQVGRDSVAVRRDKKHRAET